VRHPSDDEDRLLSDGPLDRLSAVPKGPDGTGTRRRLVPFQLPPKTINLDVWRGGSRSPVVGIVSVRTPGPFSASTVSEAFGDAKMSNREDGAVFRQEMDQSFDERNMDSRNRSVYPAPPT
jgi:hypothetical protein